MANFDAVTSATSLEDARAIIQATVSSNPVAAADYSWLIPVSKDTTEAFIGRDLAANPPKKVFAVQDLSGNLQVASMHLDQALNRQDKLHDLELSAVNALIDDLVFDKSSERDERLAISGLRAMLKDLPDAPGNATEADVHQLHGIRRDVVNARRQYRNVKGSAMNLGERIEFLRALQADTVRSIYERLISVRLCLASSGIAKMPPIPAWNSESGLDSLRQLALWSRRAIRQVEGMLPAERTVTLTTGTHDPNLKCFDTNDQTLSKADILDRINRPGFDDIKFDFDQALIKAIINYTNTKNVRLIGMSVGMVFDEDEAELKRLLETEDAKMTLLTARRELAREWRSRQRFGIKILAPVQTAAFDNGEILTWAPERIELDDEVASASVLGFGNQSLVPQPLIQNLSPLGRWVISLNSFSKTPSKPRAVISDYAAGTTHPLVRITGLIISFKLAVRL